MTRVWNRCRLRNSRPIRRPSADRCVSATRGELRELWRQVVDLPIRQRTALLLHLRAESGESVLPFLPLLDIASVDDIAELLCISTRELAELWGHLPLADDVICEPPRSHGAPGFEPTSRRPCPAATQNENGGVLMRHAMVGPLGIFSSPIEDDQRDKRLSSSAVAEKC